MNISLTLVILSIILILISILFISFKKDKTQFHYIFNLLLASALLWCIGSLGEVTSKDIYAFNPFVQTCNYFGIALVSVFILLLGRVFAHKHITLTWRYALLFILPLGTAVAVATNESHHLFMKEFSIIIQDTVLGPLMWFHYFYCYLYVTIGLSYLLKQAVNNSGLFSKQAIVLTAGISIALVVNILVSFGILRGGCYSTAPAFVVLLIAIGVATIKLDLFNIVPIALQKVVEHISDDFIVIDKNRKIVYFNRSNQPCFSENHEVVIGQDFKDLLNSSSTENCDAKKFLDYIKMAFDKKDSMSFDTIVNSSDKIRYYNIEITPMFNKNKYIGTIVLSKDTTKYIENIQIIKDYQLLLESNLEKVTKDKQELLIRSAIMEKVSKTDALTDMYNHRTFQEYLDTIIRQISESENSMQLAILDIDDFKKINDTFGHSVGDIILQRISNKIKTMVTIDDITARYGGEEFVVILTNKTMKQSLKILESLRQAIQDENHLELNQSVTVSIGVHEYSNGEPKEDVFNKADDALYKAKHSGKNKIVVSNDISFP